MRLEEPSHPAPAGAPHALVRFPPGFDGEAPWDLVVFLHGWNGCVEVLMGAGATRCLAEEGPTHEGWGLAQAFDAARSDALLLMPQLAFRRREGDAGRFADPSFAERYVAAVAAAVEGWPQGPPRRVVVLAHSAGFEAALAWVRSELPISEVVLFDALYAGTEGFATWVGHGGDRRLVSIHTGRGSTARQSRRLTRLAARAELAVGDSLASPAPVVVVRTHAPHREVPRAHLAEVLRGPAEAPTSGAEIQ